MSRKTHIPIGLDLVNELVAAGKTHFTFAEAVRRLDRSPTATANTLRRLRRAGLIDRVSRGQYVIRQLGVLGTRAAAEDVAIAVAAAFSCQPHRIAYRSALDENELVAHPVRTLYVATTRRVRTKAVSGRPLQTIIEPEPGINIGVAVHGPSRVSDLERSLLDAAARPELGGGAAVLGEALLSAASRVDAERLFQYARALGWAPALRRIGSICDALEILELAGKLKPLLPPTSDLDLEPGVDTARVWRDSRWRVRWPQTPEELANAVRQ